MHFIREHVELKMFDSEYTVFKALTLATNSD